MEKENIVIKDLTTRKEIEGLESAATIEGLTLESIPDFVKFVEQHSGGLKLNSDGTFFVYVTKGRTMNKAFKLRGTNKYPDDLSIVSIKLEDFDCTPYFCIKRFQCGIRWMDDIIANNKERNKRC